MKIDHIKREHILEAVRLIDIDGVPKQYRQNTYCVRVNENSYPFKYLIRIAHKLAEGRENEWLDFISRKKYRDYVESLGFTLVSNAEIVSFFNIKDISQLAAVAGKTYDKENAGHQLAYKNIKNNAWKKTKYWCDRVLSELDGFSGECRKVWSQRNWENGERVSSFKEYTWARIYRKEDSEKDIYFTVGIDGHKKALVYKLDYQHLGKTNLTVEQRTICKRLIETSDARWKQISLDELVNYNWDKLIEETIDFMKEYILLYDKVVEETWNINQKRIARIAYSSNGWIMPSGKYGKSEDLNLHEGEFGYGHEEWLFDMGKLIKAYHYGFIEPIRKKQSTYEGKQYDVWLYAIHSVTKIRYWVGEIKNVQVIAAETAEEIKDIGEF